MNDEGNAETSARYRRRHRLHEAAKGCEQTILLLDEHDAHALSDARARVDA
jgi:hypothetical protein